MKTQIVMVGAGRSLTGRGLALSEISVSRSDIWPDPGPTIDHAMRRKECGS